MINIHNYEIWFLDYAEGNLNAEDEKKLMLFLQNNPQLKEEFASFELISLEKEEISYSKKSVLKHSDHSDKEMSEFETLAIDKIENNISVDNNIRLLELLSDKKNSNAYKILKLTKLKSDPEIRFKYKNKLKKGKNQILTLLKSPYSIAAILILIIFAQIFNNFQSKPELSQNIQNTDLVSNSEKEIVNEKSIKNDIQNQIVTSINKNNLEASLNNERKTESNKKETNFELEEIENSTVTNNNPDTDIVLAEQNIPAIERLKTLSIKNNFVTEEFSNDSKLISEMGINSNNIKSEKLDKKSVDNIVLLTPKEFLIKEVKGNLNIDDKKYNSFDPITTLMAVAEKTNLVDATYINKRNNDQREITLSIGKFEFQRKW
ncbi:MAG: hypothetical protein R2771_03310 [Saprospiraceae bacterium]